MTIFDSIRYPISEPPTEEQIMALPGPLREKFLKCMNGITRVSHLNHDQVKIEKHKIEVFLALYDHPEVKRRFHYAVEKLRKSIEKYDDNI